MLYLKDAEFEVVADLKAACGMRKHSSTNSSPFDIKLNRWRNVSTLTKSRCRVALHRSSIS